MELSWPSILVGFSIIPVAVLLFIGWIRILDRIDDAWARRNSRSTGQYQLGRLDALAEANEELKELREILATRNNQLDSWRTELRVDDVRVGIVLPDGRIGTYRGYDFADPNISTITITEDTPSATVSITNEGILAQLGSRDAAAAVNEFTRSRMREESFYRQIMPPTLILNDELDRATPFDISTLPTVVETSAAGYSVGIDTVSDAPTVSDVRQPRRIVLGRNDAQQPTAGSGSGDNEHPVLHEVGQSSASERDSRRAVHEPWPASTDLGFAGNPSTSSNSHMFDPRWGDGDY